MRNSHTILSIEQKSALMLSATPFPTNNSTSSVVIMGMIIAVSNSSLPTLLPSFMNEINHLPSPHRQSVACNLPWSYPLPTRYSIALDLDSVHILGMGAYLQLVSAPRYSMVLILPFLMTKTASMPRVIGLLYVRPQSLIPSRARTLYHPLREVLGSRPNPVMGLLLDLIRVHTRHSCPQTVPVHIVPTFDAVALIISRHSPNHVLFHPLLNARVPFAMTGHLVVSPARLLTVAPVQRCSLNGRDLRCTEMSPAWMNERQ